MPMKKIAQQVFGTGMRKRPQTGHIKSHGIPRALHVLQRQLIQQFSRFCEVLRAPRQRIAVRGESLLQQRQQTMPQEIARVVVIGIALVFNPMQPVLLCVFGQRAARDIQQRTQGCRGGNWLEQWPFDPAQDRPFDFAQDRPFDIAQDRHCRYAPDSRATQQLQ